MIGGKGGDGENKVITDGFILCVISGKSGDGKDKVITDDGQFLVFSVARVEVVMTRWSLMVVCA